MVMRHSLSAVIQQMIDEDHARRYAPAEVISVSGTEVVVRRLGSSVNEGPYAVYAGVSGYVKAGDRVLLRQQAGAIVVEMPVEGSVRANLMQLVGDDDQYVTTISATVWVSLLEVTGLAVGPNSRMNFDLMVYTTVVGAAGPDPKEIRITLNGGTPFSIIVTEDTPGTSSRWFFSVYVSTYPTNGPSPQRVLWATYSNMASPLGNVQAVTWERDVSTINSILIEGRTGDTVQGNDIVGATQLVVYS